MPLPPIPPIIARREPARNKFFTHVEEDLGTDAGTYTYSFIDTTWDAVLVVPVLADGRLVIERIYRHPYRAYVFEFPAGGIEHGEDPCAAGARELEEETGYRASSVRLLQSFEPVPGLCRMRLQVVLATDLKQTGKRSHEALELIEVVEADLPQAVAWTKIQPCSGFLLTGVLLWEQEIRRQQSAV